jgi:hypothetical protein
MKIALGVCAFRNTGTEDAGQKPRAFAPRFPAIRLSFSASEKTTEREPGAKARGTEALRPQRKTLPRG